MLNKTAGETQNDLLKKELGSHTQFDLGYASCDDFWKELYLCLDNHQKLLESDPEVKKIFPDNEYCIIVQYATDPLLKAVIRRKFVPWPHLPDPRPQQSVFHYNQTNEKLKLLWSLPGPMAMAELSESAVVSSEYVRMKAWCDWWYEGTFWHNIRSQHNLSMLSEHELMRKNRKLGSKLVDDTELGLGTDAFYLPEVRIKKLEAKANSGSVELSDDVLRKAN